MDEPVKLSRKYNTYVPRKKESGAPIDWEALARSRNFFNNSAHEMFKQLYANTKEDFKKGKLSVNKLAPYLGVSVPTLSKALKKYGFSVSAGCIKSKHNNKNRTKYSYPYRLLGFKTEWKMWVHFIENKITAKQIVNKVFETTGRSFLCRTVGLHLYNTRRLYKKVREDIEDEES